MADSSIKLPVYNINNLPDSILTEILTRLPTCKSTHQCKRVCKRWLSLISNSYFIKRFVSVHRRDYERVTLLHQYRYFAYHDAECGVNSIITSHPVHTKLDAVVTEDVDLKLRGSFELQFLPFCLTADVLGSCRDLLVVYDRWNSFELLKQGLGATFYVCNILTKEWTSLPPSPSSYWKSGLVGLITYEPKSSQFSTHYKLVHISKSKQFKAEVYSSETGEWTKPQIIPCSNFPLNENCITNSTPFRRKLHWIINKNNILSFDPFSPENQSRLIDLPILDENTQTNETECLGVFGEYLYLSRLARVNGNQRLRIWMLEDYDTGKWGLRNSVDYTVGLGNVGWLLGFHPKEKTVLYVRCKNRVFACNVVKGTVEVVRECDESWTWHLSNERDIVFPVVHPCWPSLVQPPVIEKTRMLCNDKV